MKKEKAENKLDIKGGILCLFVLILIGGIVLFFWNATFAWIGIGIISILVTLPLKGGHTKKPQQGIILCGIIGEKWRNVLKERCLTNNHIVECQRVSAYGVS